MTNPAQNRPADPPSTEEQSSQAPAYLDLDFESLKFVYGSVPRALVLVTLLSTLLATVLWQQVPTFLIVGWWVCMTLISAVRALLSRQFNHQELSKRPFRYWQFSLYYWSTLSALVWGMSVWLFYPFASDGFIPVILVMLAGVCGATATLSVLPKLFLAYSCASLLPLIVWLFISAPTQGSLLGVIVLFYFLFLNVVSRLAQSALQRTIELSNELVIAKEQAEKANQAKSLFLSSMNHELRTPLTAILGFSELLQRADLNSQNLERVNHIKKASDHLRGMIDDILDISRVEAGRFELSYEDVSIPELMTDVQNMLMPLAQDHQITIQVDTDWCRQLRGQLDKKKLKQILLNLTANAIKYNHPGGQVLMTGELPGSDKLRLVVTDTGKGISPENLELVFQPFERLDSARSDIVGAGIGLALCRQLATTMNGSVNATSTLGEGSSFWVEIPLRKTIGIPATLGQDTKAEVSTPVTDIDISIVLIEDNPTTQLLFKAIVEPYPSLKLWTAADGLTGYKTTLEQLPDLVLLDLDLAVLTGREVLAKIRENPLTANIKVIIVSASAMSTDIKELNLLGADGYVTKPYNTTQLIDLIVDIASQTNR